MYFAANHLEILIEKWNGSLCMKVRLEFLKSLKEKKTSKEVINSDNDIYGVDTNQHFTGI